MKENRYNHTGKKFGELEVIERIGLRGKNIIWRCFCHACKKECEKLSASFLEYTRSCGCLGIRRGKDSTLWGGYEDISKEVLSRIKRTAKGRKIAYSEELTPKVLWDLYILQDRKCALSKLPIQFGRYRKQEVTASLDRIDSSLPYRIGNVQWLHKKVNISKHTMQQNEFIDLCKLIALNS